MKTTIRLLTSGLALASLLFATGCQTVSITSTQAIGGPTYPPLPWPSIISNAGFTILAAIRS